MDDSLSLRSHVPCLGAQEILESRKCTEPAQPGSMAVTGKGHEMAASA